MEKQSPHDSFKDHVIKRHDERSLLLLRPGVERSSLFCTIAIDDHVQIVVFGDFGPMVFAYHRGTLERRIAWMGSHPEADSYVIEKANIGMSNFGRAMTVTTAEYFEADVREGLDVLREELYPLDGQPPASNEISRLRCALTWDAFAEKLDADDLSMLEIGWTTPALATLDGYLNELGFEDNLEWIGDLGERPIPEIGLAHAALRRAHLLLRGDLKAV